MEVPYTRSDCTLIVDLDGTLIRTDSLIESIVCILRRNPLYFLLMPIWLLGGRAAFKERVAKHADLCIDQLPYCEVLVEYLKQERARGRSLILATAAHRSIAHAVAQHLGLFDRVLATEGTRNLKGREKLAAILVEVGPRFSYAGNCTDDLPIWDAAESAVIVGAPRKIADSVRLKTPVEADIAFAAAGPADWLRVLRIHQWLKNVLIFVPLLTAFAFTDLASVWSAALAFVSFSFAASGTYLLNDIWDLDNDRFHPRKRLRPLASGAISVMAGGAVAVLLVLVALVLAWIVGAGFVGILLAYLILTTLYSWFLKAYVLIDVLALAALYTMRIVAGALAIGVVVSPWLLAFSIFIFLSLALVKRCAELRAVADMGQQMPRGRDYQSTDLAVLWPMTIGAGLCGIVVFGVFLAEIEEQERYASPQLMWLVGFALIYWLARLWIKTGRGQMHDDPLVFALRDSGSRAALLIMVAVTLVAYFIPL